METNALTYKLNFTDGTFLTMSNNGENNPIFPAGTQHELIVPNYYFATFGNTAREYSPKYDYDGNEYIFDNLGVTINGIRYDNIEGRRMAFTYNPINNELSIIYYRPSYNLIDDTPVINETSYGVTVCCIDRNTGTGKTFGELLNDGIDRFLNHINGWYKLEDILSKKSDSPFTSTVLYFGHSVLDRHFQDAIYWDLLTGSYPLNIDILNSVEEYDPEVPAMPDYDDPYDPAGESAVGGGTGDFDGTSDAIDFPSLPTLSAVDTGFITLFNPSLAQLKALSNYMWSNAFDLDTFRKLFADPMDCILGLSIVPVAVPNGAIKTVTVGNISTGVSMTTASVQYVEVDCGTLNVNEYWGAYLDYSPYTKCEIYLPYIGTHPLDVDDVMNKAVHVKYHIDILSGACSAYVKCGDSVIYEFIGQCSSSIPVSANDWTNVINGVLSIAGSIGTMVATGGASAPMGLQQIASTSVNSMKPTVEKSGSMSGTGGMLGVQMPYLILTRPRQALPAGQNSFMGYPAFINEYLGGLSGYTEVEKVHLENIPASDSEITEIENLLKGGVIF